jgi:hypothetical protein
MIVVNPARRMWRVIEPLHAVLYYAPEAFDEAKQLGYAVDTRWPSHFAWRAAPLGPAEVFASRGWTPAEWDEARRTLIVRGRLDPDGAPTPAGADARAALENHTDELAAAPWRELGPATGRFAQPAGPLAARIAASGLLPKQSALGMGASS